MIALTPTNHEIPSYFDPFPSGERRGSGVKIILKVK
jgi:hypothetical protein